MSRAFTSEAQNEAAMADLGERPVSPHRNLVTPQGLAAIEAELARLRSDLAEGEMLADRDLIARASRDLRYWISRRETAEVSVPEPDEHLVRFGMSVTVEGEDGARRTWRIVGEDEADAAHGSVSHVSPMARALFGKSVGETGTVNGREWTIVDLSATPQSFPDSASSSQRR
jgi:transcription elongation GreA/GreB family factor